jgi:hypothetical protein
VKTSLPTPPPYSWELNSGHSALSSLPGILDVIGGDSALVRAATTSGGDDKRRRIHGCLSLLRWGGPIPCLA